MLFLCVNVMTVLSAINKHRVSVSVDKASAAVIGNHAVKEEYLHDKENNYQHNAKNNNAYSIRLKIVVRISGIE